MIYNHLILGAFYLDLLAREPRYYFDVDFLDIYLGTSDRWAVFSYINVDVVLVLTIKWLWYRDTSISVFNENLQITKDILRSFCSQFLSYCFLFPQAQKTVFCLFARKTLVHPCETSSRAPRWRSHLLLESNLQGLKPPPKSD